MNFLVIGFGKMGCRHVQSLQDFFPNSSIGIVEPVVENFKKYSTLIDLDKNNVEYFEDLNSLSGNYDFCIIATSSAPRFGILKQLIIYGVRVFLLEKVVFQSQKQFDEIISLQASNGLKIYCNFVSRYFPNYIDIKNQLQKKSVKMIVSGGDFGLACNCLHYMDIFQYITGSEPIITSYSLIENKNGCSRGKNYKELIGSINLSNVRGDTLSIISDPKKGIGVLEVIITSKNTTCILNENTLSHITIDKEIIEHKEFEIIKTSRLTGQIIKDHLEGKVLLPGIDEVRNSHLEIFKVFNGAFKLDINANCPIT